MDGSKTKVVAAIAVVVVIVAAAAAFFVTQNNSGSGDKDTYYFYFDGMETKNGWASSKSSDIEKAFVDAAKSKGLTATFSDSGRLTIEGYEGTYDPDTGTGTGLGVFEYISTDVSAPSAGYFVAGPVMGKVVSNIVYVTFSPYSFDEDWNTLYAISPSTSDAWKTAGPFAA